MYVLSEREGQYSALSFLIWQLYKGLPFHRLQRRRENYRSKDFLHGREEGERLGKEQDERKTNSKYISYMGMVKDFEVLDIIPPPIVTEYS